MYYSYFGLREEPFGVSPDPRFFQQTGQHREAVASLYYAVTMRRGFAALIGEPGLGKTSVLVKLLDRLAPEAKTVLLVHPYLDNANLLDVVLANLGIDAEHGTAQKYRQLYEFLLDLHRQRKTCVVILDEAQNLGMDVLESLRMLSNFETPTEKLIQFVLVGQPGLARLLESPGCEQIRQRINVVARLDALSAQEVEAYIAYRLKIAGAAENPFSKASVIAIARESAGIPRNVNTICFNALTLGFAGEKRTINESDIAETVHDLGISRKAPAPIPDPPLFSFAMPTKASAPRKRRAGMTLAVTFLVLLTMALATAIWLRETGYLL